jgi:hypothetical protein
MKRILIALAVFVIALVLYGGGLPGIDKNTQMALALGFLILVGNLSR